MLKTLVFVAGIGFVGAIGFGAYVVSQHPIHDITTDFEDPPAIIAGAAEGINRKNPAQYGGNDGKSEAVADIQRQVYADLGPLYLDADQASVYDKAIALVKARDRFDILATDRDAGVIEAIYTSSVFKFIDDFIIRIRTDGTKTRVDFRSKSRVGRSDLGANAKRIRDFQAALKQEF